MKIPGLLLTMSILCCGQAFAADRAAVLDYEPSIEFPYGRPHPDAPVELGQFAFMIGQNDCSEERLNSATNEWTSGQRTWDAYYFMNGFAIRDTGSSGSSNNGNIRIYDEAGGQWQVTFFAMPGFGTGIWRGGMEGEKMILRQPQKAPGTDFDGFSRLTFSNISAQGFSWDGEWESVDGSVVFPFWRIRCEKRG